MLWHAHVYVSYCVQGTDFMERVTSGVGWGSYMERVGHFWNDHGQRARICEIDPVTRMISLHQPAMHDMLNYVSNYTKTTTKVPAKKKQKVAVPFDKYFGERALWNLAYWITAGKTPPAHDNGWITDAYGRTIRREGAQGQVGTITLDIKGAPPTSDS